MDINLPMQNRIRNTRRFAEVLRVLVRHGYASFITETGLDRLIERGKELVGLSEPEAVSHRLPHPIRLRMILEELGPTYIKLGQILSTRPDLIPPEVAEEFRHLQSECPTVPWDSIKGRLEQEFPGKLEELFEHIDEKPEAAASIAQTHRAVLTGGTPIILKVLRPGIEKAVDTDMEILSEVAEFTEKHFKDLGFSPSEVVREFSKQIRKEMNLVHEARATDRLREYFESNPDIHFTRVFWEATTEKVLALERVEGTLLSRLAPDSLPPSERRRVVESGATAVFRMCLDFGFFHADPHPGNIFALPGGSICFIDCGMTGHIDRRTQQQLANLVHSVLDADLDKTIRIVLTLADAPLTHEVDRAFRNDVWEIVSRFHVGSIEELDLSDLLNNFFEVLRTHRIRCPGDLVFLIKALTTIQGVGQQIDPEFDLVGHVRPLIHEVVRKQYGFSALRKRFRRSMFNYVDVIESLPDEIRKIASQFRQRDFSVRLEHNGLESLRQTVDHASRIISVALILSAMIVGASNLATGRIDATEWGIFSVIGLASLAFAGLFCLMLLFGGRQKR